MAQDHEFLGLRHALRHYLQSGVGRVKRIEGARRNREEGREAEGVFITDEGW